MSGRKETVLDLAKFIDKGVQVKLTGGRQVTGTLKGYDQLLNLVLDEAIEFLRDTLSQELIKCGNNVDIDDGGVKCLPNRRKTSKRNQHHFFVRSG